MKSPSTEWTVVTIETDERHADALATRVSRALRRDAIEVRKPDVATVWLEIYFEDAVEALVARDAIAAWRGARTCAARSVRPRDWQAFWKTHFRAHDVGSRLRIVPLWEARTDRAKGRVRLLLDPGLSFGTGEHFTTRFCLETIDRLCHKSAPRSALDIGTGSGILAIAAARLGVRRVVATDNDPQAVVHAGANIRRNRVADRVKLRVHDVRADAAPGRFDLVVANVYGAILVECAPRIVQSVKRTLVLSGLREFELDGVADRYMSLGGREVARDGDGQWGGMVLEWTH